MAMLLLNVPGRSSFRMWGAIGPCFSACPSDCHQGRCRAWLSWRSRWERCRDKLWTRAARCTETCRYRCAHTQHTHTAHSLVKKGIIYNTQEKQGAKDKSKLPYAYTNTSLKHTLLGTSQGWGRHFNLYPIIHTHTHTHST